MIVETIKEVMDKIGLTQGDLSKELSKIANKKYNQSMISKRLAHDDNITVSEILFITDIVNSHIKKHNLKNFVKPIVFIQGDKSK